MAPTWKVWDNLRGPTHKPSFPGRCTVHHRRWGRAGGSPFAGRGGVCRDARGRWVSGT